MLSIRLKYWLRVGYYGLQLAAAATDLRFTIRLFN